MGSPGVDEIIFEATAEPDLLVSYLQRRVADAASLISCWILSTGIWLIGEFPC